MYRLMSSNFFINYSNGLIHFFYKVMGKKLTNAIINNSVGDLFTSGETIESLKKDIAFLKTRDVGGIANYVVEGLSTMNDKFIDNVIDVLIETINTMESD